MNNAGKQFILSLGSIFLIIWLVCSSSASGSDGGSASIDVRVFGAQGDDSHDDTSAFNRAVDGVNRNLAQGHSTTLLLPAGTYRLGRIAPINLPQSVNLDIVAVAGARLVEIQDRPALTVREIIIPHGGMSRLSISGLTVTRPDLKATSFTGNGFEVLGAPQSEGGGQIRMTLSDLQCAGEFGACLKLENSTNATLRGIRSVMPGVYDADPAKGVGIWFHTTPDASGRNATIDNHILDCVITGGFAGVRLDNHHEGLQIAQATIVGTAYGVYAPRGDNISGVSWLSISQSHFNTSLSGVYAENASNLNINGNLFFSLPPVSYGSKAQLPRDFTVFSGGRSGWAGVWALNASTSIIANNSFYGFLRPGQASTGIRFYKADIGKTPAINPAETTTISGNIMEAMNNGPLQIDPSSSNISVVGNVAIVTRSGFLDHARGPRISLSNNIYDDAVEDIGTQNDRIVFGKNLQTVTLDGSMKLLGTNAIFFGTGSQAKPAMLAAQGAGLKMTAASLLVTGGVKLGVGARFQSTLKTPASSSAPCFPGEFMDDEHYHYVCVKPNMWRRVALTDF